MNRANLELIKPKFGSSFEVKHYLETSTNDKASFWHFHPELELVFVKGGNGIRHIGNHISYYQDGDLVLIGSNLPHNGFTDKNTGNESEVVVQFKADFLGQSFFEVQEFQKINALFNNSLNGLAFYGETKTKIGARMEKLAGLGAFDRLIEFIKILHKLAKSSESEQLNASGYTVQMTKQDNPRAAAIFEHIKSNYREEMDLEEIASLANMTVPSFCRYFKKLTDKTFTNFVNEYRIIEACKLIAEADISINEICYQVGFNNISHFMKHFKKVTNQSPSKYRKEMNQTVTI